jgi:hypothetical protein
MSALPSVGIFESKILSLTSLSCSVQFRICFHNLSQLAGSRGRERILKWFSEVHLTDELPNVSSSPPLKSTNHFARRAPGQSEKIPKVDQQCSVRDHLS